MIQQSVFWVCIQRKQNQNLEVIPALPCSLQHYSLVTIWEKNPCPLMDEWINMSKLYVMGYYSAMRKKEILLFAKTWMKLKAYAT